MTLVRIKASQLYPGALVKRHHHTRSIRITSATRFNDWGRITVVGTYEAKDGHAFGDYKANVGGLEIFYEVEE